MSDLPDLSRTAAEFDKYMQMHDAWAAEDVAALTNAQASASFKALEAQGLAVGRAFVLDTADQNSADKAPLVAPAYWAPRESWIAKMVAQWREQR